jgi:hypothetical protein
MMQLSCPGLALVTKAGFMVLTPRQSNNPPNGKVQIHQDRKRQDERKARRTKSKVKSMLIIFFDIKGNGLKELILAGQTVSSAYECDILR